METKRFKLGSRVRKFVGRSTVLRLGMRGSRTTLLRRLYNTALVHLTRQHSSEGRENGMEKLEGEVLPKI